MGWANAHLGSGYLLGFCCEFIVQQCDLSGLQTEKVYEAFPANIVRMLLDSEVQFRSVLSLQIN